jgi:hypothetical protein
MARRVDVAKDRGLKLLFGLALAGLVAGVGCGRTHDCEACDPPIAPISGAGGTSAGSGGSVVTSGTGGSISTGGRPQLTCDVGAVEVPLVRYSLVDLARTMGALTGTVPDFTREANERSEQGPERFPTFRFVEQLTAMAQDRAEAAPISEEDVELCEPEREDRTGCIDSWIRARGERLYRRPLTDAQVEGYVLQFQSWAQSGSGVAAARIVLRSMMLSPYFVFRIELAQGGVSAFNAAPMGAPVAPDPTLPPGTVLDPFEMAARLSHFATRSGPDGELLASAASGQLLDPNVRLDQYERLASTPEGVDGRTLQHLEWLMLDDVTSSAVVSDAELSQAMSAQVSRFIVDVLQNRNGSLLELLSSPRIPLNQQLAQHYGIDSTVGEELELVELPPTLFGGILSHGATLSRYGKLTERGAHLVMDRLQCMPIPPPPPSIDFANLPYMGTTPRERITSVTATNAPCNACHALFNGAGFALDAFDSEGRLTGFDTSGSELYTPEGSVMVDDPAGLGRAIATGTAGKSCAIQRYLAYAVDRPVSEGDGPLVQCLINALAGPEDLDLNQLARLVVTSGAMHRTTRAPLNIAGASSAAGDPVDHAIDETSQLAAAFPEPAEKQLLQAYADSLRQWLATLPNQ